MSFLKNFFTCSGITLISRVLSFIRDLLIAMIFGSSYVADVFLVAFRLPISCRSIMADDHLNYVFVPQYSKKLITDRQSAKYFCSKFFTMLICFLLIIVILAEIMMPWLIRIIVPGFALNPAKLTAVITIARIIFPYLILSSMVSILISIMQANNNFYVTAIAPIITNSVLASIMIYCIYNKPSSTDGELLLTAKYLGFGILFAGVIQFLVARIVIYYKKLSLSIVNPMPTKDMMPTIKDVGSVFMGSCAGKLNNLINQMILSMFTGGVSYIYFADRIIQFPMSLIGSAIGAVLLPSLSKYVQQNDTAKAVNFQNRAIEFSLLLSIPIACIMFIYSKEIVITLFGKGKFTAQDFYMIGTILKLMSVGLVPAIMNSIIIQNYFSRGDTRNPLKMSFVRIVTSSILSIVLVFKFKHFGVASSLMISNWLYFALLYSQLHSNSFFQIDQSLKNNFIKIIGSSIVTVCATLTMKKFTSLYFNNPLIYISSKAMIIFTILSATMILYFLCIYLSGFFKKTSIAYTMEELPIKDMGDKEAAMS